MKTNKKFIFLLVVSLILTLSTTAFAATSDTTSTTTSDTNAAISDQSNIMTMPQKDIYGKETRPRTDLNASGGISPNTYYSIYFTVPKYCQQNYPNVYMQTRNKSIAAEGCALTDVAMVEYYYGQSLSTPPWVNTQMGNYADPLYWSLVPSRLPGSYIGSLDTFINNPTVTQLTNICFQSFNYGEPVIVGFNRDNDPNRPHWVLANALYGDGTHMADYGCIDPYDGQYKNLYDVIGSQQLIGIAVFGR
jgi:hypothetical protein